MTAARRWTEALARWAWPQELLAAAPEDPWQLAPQELAARGAGAGGHESPADVAAFDALPRRGTVLDVGCGTGGSSAALHRVARRITGVDPRREMLSAFEERVAVDLGFLARLLGGAPELRAVQGRWPQVADDVEPHDVVLAHHVLYDVTEAPDRFVAALTDHARERVVLVLTARHPLHWVNPYAEQLHGIRRPSEPTATVAADVVREAVGMTPRFVPWTEEFALPSDRDALLRVVARRVCARPEQLDDLRAILHRVSPPTTRDLVALVWPGTA